ncbi:hypothetical protein PAXRUDRAFT_30956 [Paxillus rubicundulus Ve08.2h10]|uniref:Arrestin-like N-terminal domain-containing protein n=1 Tax=Paxillus rubicundulus Ve08.2h10 TaxID=930991 RepID=A0A0D0E3J2_9AGAM|nr:hypothetical protein PAXRUDRAFT_30956 [Paxillus rubicundulus Ve08.2h10]
MELPDYSPSTPAPDYSSTPLAGEKCIQRTPSQTPDRHENCAFIYQEHDMSLTLRGCREEGGVPTFGLCSTVHGEFEPTDRDRIVSVVIKLEGQVLLRGRSRTQSYVLFSNKRTLWQRDDSAENMCPSLLPLSISFPSAYRDENDRALRLPPSMSIRKPRRVAIAYSLNILVQKTRRALFVRKTRDVCMSAYLCYRPRVRPPRPSPTCFSGLKHCPDEWQEEVWDIRRKPSGEESQDLAAQCHFFLPSVRVFSTSEPIPFHLSFCSSTEFLRTTAQHISPQPDVPFANPIHVFLLRQTTVHGSGSKTVDEEVLGTGTISPSPTTAIEAISAENTLTMSWDGQVQCERPIGHISFSAMALEVKDFLVLSLVVPPGPVRSMLPQMHRAIPIRLVTHPCIDRS